MLNPFGLTLCFHHEDLMAFATGRNVESHDRYWLLCRQTSAKATNKDKLYDIYNQDHNAHVGVLDIALYNIVSLQPTTTPTFT